MRHPCLAWTRLKHRELHLRRGDHHLRAGCSVEVVRNKLRQGSGVSVVPGDRSVVGRRPVGEIEHHFVHVAPAPPLRGIITLNDRMMGCMKMPGGVLAGRLIATSNMAASATNAKVKPSVALFQAFLAPQRARDDFADAIQMGACFRHDSSPHYYSVGPCECARNPWIACTT
jgi:hypothetical protein